MRASESALDNEASCSYIDIMSSVGLRALKNQLSKYVQRARSGETVTITDRGEVVAELVPPKKTRNGQPITTLNELSQRGLVYGGGKNRADRYPTMPRALKKRSGIDLLDEERASI